jgi:hypothetical protein
MSRAFQRVIVTIGQLMLKWQRLQRVTFSSFHTGTKNHSLRSQTKYIFVIVSRLPMSKAFHRA